MQRMLDITSNFERDFEVRFKRDKSSVMVVNGNEQGDGRTWQLTRLEIDRLKEYKYLGITLADLGLGKAKKEKATKAAQIMVG